MLCIGRTENKVLQKSEQLMNNPMKNSDFSENLITNVRGSVYEPFLTWHTLSEEPSEVQFFEKNMLVQQIVEKSSKNMIPENVRNQFPWARDT